MQDSGSPRGREVGLWSSPLRGVPSPGCTAEPKPNDLGFLCKNSGLDVDNLVEVRSGESAGPTVLAPECEWTSGRKCTGFPEFTSSLQVLL